MCYSLVFIALITGVEPPKSYINGFFNTVDECEAGMVRKAKTLFPNDQFIFTRESSGFSGKYVDQAGSKSYFVCANANINYEEICNKSLLGSYSNCNCESLYQTQ